MQQQTVTLGYSVRELTPIVSSSMPSPMDTRNLVVQARESVVKEQKKSRPTLTIPLLSPNLVRITVGNPVSENYHVHYTILCARNPVFDAGYDPSSRFAEGQGRSNQLNFPDQSPQVVDLPARWLYNENAHLRPIAVAGGELPATRERSLLVYIHLHTFAGSRCIQEFQFGASKETVRFYRQYNFFILEPTLCLVYEVTLSAAGYTNS